MVYVYDILLNFNNEGQMYDFFEWEASDNIMHIKRIPLFRVSSDTVRNMSNNIFKVDSGFLTMIKNFTEVYQNKRIEKLMYASLFTDGKMVVAVGFADNGQSVFKSCLLLDEEDEVIELALRMETKDINYKIEKVQNRNHFITRGEEEVRLFLKEEIDKTYKKQDINKLKYIYVEYFDDNKENIDIIYKELINSLKFGINDKHNLIYNLLKMTYSKK